MRTNLRVPFRYAIVAGVVSLTLSAKSQNWETIFAPVLPGTTSPHCILIDPISNEFAPHRVFIGVGRLPSEDPSSSNRLFILDRVAGQPQSIAGFDGVINVRRLGFDPASRNLFALSQTSTGWQMRKSGDGLTWTAIGAFENASPTGFAADDRGGLFISESWDDGSATGLHWMVRKSTDQGQTWSTVDNLTNAMSARMHFVSGTNGGIFVVGYRKGGSGFSSTYGWMVRRSRDGGATWKTVDSYAGSGNVGANAITSDRQGRIYVSGWGTPEVVRSSSNGGDTWISIHTNPRGANVNDMTVDNSDNLWLVGNLGGWFVVRRDAQGVWHEIEQPFGGADGSMPIPSSANAMAVDRAGNLFVAGAVRDLGSLDPFTLAVQQRLSETPVLTITKSGPDLLLSWPAAMAGFQLEMADEPGAADWTIVSESPLFVGDLQTVTLPVTSSTKFFRLRKP